MIFQPFSINTLVKDDSLIDDLSQIVKAKNYRCSEIGLGDNVLELEEFGYCTDSEEQPEIPGIYLKYSKLIKFQYLEKVSVRASFFEDDVRKILFSGSEMKRLIKNNTVILYQLPIMVNNKG